MLRVARLEQALEVARSYGLKQEADEIRRELGSIKPEELGLQQISAELEIPTEEVERFLGSFEQVPDWRDALLLLAAQGPPGGSPADLDEHVDELMQGNPIQVPLHQSACRPR